MTYVAPGDYCDSTACTAKMLGCQGGTDTPYKCARPVTSHPAYETKLNQIRETCQRASDCGKAIIIKDNIQATWQC